MLIRRSILVLGLVAAAWTVASSAEASAKSADAKETGCSAAPMAPEAVVAADRTLPGSAAGGVVPASPAVFWQPALAASASPTSLRQSVLIEAQVLEKYRSFRESLRCP